MRAHALVAALVAAALCLWSCKTEFANPFDDLLRTALPHPSAALVFTSDAHALAPGARREAYAVAADGSELERLTFCSSDERSCDTLEVVSARDRKRLAARRIAQDRNEDGRLDAADGVALFVIDLERSVEAPIVGPEWNVSGLDWAPNSEVIVFSATTPGSGGVDDLFRIDPTGRNQGTLTATPGVRERRPRIDPTGSIAIFERTDGDAAAEVWVFVSTLQVSRLTSGGPGEGRLAQGDLRVGSDTDPDFSPDGRSVVFRRLTAVGDGRGQWDVFTVRTDGTALTRIAGGPAFRGPPDWGPDGILFEEVGPGGSPRILLVGADGSTLRAPVSLGSGFSLSAPRWLAPR